MEETEFFTKRLEELADKAFKRGICYYTDFLNLNELNIFYNWKSRLSFVSYELWGGFETAERKIICFHAPDSFEEPDFPIQILNTETISTKFGENLSHRDYLGAVLNLGIERSKIGDILVGENKQAYIVCHRTIGSYIADQLERVKHTGVKNSFCDRDNLEYQPVFTPVTGAVSSLRLDSMLSVAFKGSRSGLSGLVAGKKVFVNGRLIETGHYMLKEGDIVSVRGYGKFIYKETNSQTKKGRYSVTVLLYGND